MEFEQGGAQRAAYGQRLLSQLGQTLAEEFGRGFDATNLRHMRGFYQAFPIRDALRHELSWTHYRLLLRVDYGPGYRVYFIKRADLYVVLVAGGDKSSQVNDVNQAKALAREL